MTEQQGWRSCRKCRAICFSGLQGVCAASGTHDFEASGWFGLSVAPPDGADSQPGWRWCAKCQVLHHPGLGAGPCLAGGVHETANSGTYHLAYQPYAAGGQAGWRYCTRCHVLHNPEAGPGVCVTGGVHAVEPSLPYSLLLGSEPRVNRAPSVQHGWRRCRKCHSSCFGGIVGACAAGGRHDLDDSAWFAVPIAATVGGHSQGGWRWCHRCQILHHPGLGPGLCPAGGGHDSSRGTTYSLAIQPYAADGQEGWRYCTKCHALHRPDEARGTCPGGGLHETATSIAYSMLLASPPASSRPSVQCGWRRCRKCQASCYGGLKGACAGGGLHDFTDSPWYAMALSTASDVTTQAGWRWCCKCQVLFHPGAGAGLCPAGGGHDATGSGPYVMATSSYPAGGQDDWRFCKKCNLLHWRAKAGQCLAGGVHSDETSAPYSLLLGAPGLTPAQPGWRRCRVCHAVCYAGLEGMCGSGTPHDFTDSAAYSLSTATIVDTQGQDGWRWCCECQALFHPGLGAGACPATGAGHDATGSGPYHLAIAPYPSGGEQGWRYCTRCHVAQRRGDSPGKCPQGGEHTDAPTPYSLRPGGTLASRCALIVDHDAGNNPVSRFDVTLTARGANGSARAVAVRLLASAPVNILVEERGVTRSFGLDAATPLVLKASPTGRLRFMVMPPAEALSVPDLFAQSDDMALDQWIEFSPDDDLHQKLAGLTGEHMVQTPPGKAGPLLPAERLADARSLAGGVSRLIGRFAPAPPTAKTVTSVTSGYQKKDLFGDIGGGLASAGGAVAGGINSAVGAVSGAVGSVASIASDVANAIASAAQGAVGSAAQVFDTIGAAAQVLIKNVATAAPRLLEDFASTAIPAATQLAIDVADKVTVIALIVVDGVQSIVKTVVENVESAARLAVAFFKRVGVVIQAVIDFLAALFDWDAILAIQSDLKAMFDARWSGFAALIEDQRAALPGSIARLQAGLSESSGGGSGGGGGGSSIGAFMALGGQFGYLMGRLESLLADAFKDVLSALGPVGEQIASVASAVAGEVQAFVQSVVASPLFAAVTDPGKLIGVGADAVMSLVRPFAAGALGVAAKVLDAVLAIAPMLASAIRQVLQQRISIPVLTDFIELVVFRRRQQLSLESLITLVTAAFLHCARTLFTAARELSFDAGPEEPIDPGAVLAIVLSMMTIVVTGSAISGGEASQDIAGAIGSIFGILGTLMTPPHSVPQSSFFFPEQWACWGFNVLASVVQVADSQRAAGGLPSLGVLKGLSAYFGVCILATAGLWHGLGFTFGEGDRHLAGLDLGNQILSGLNDFSPLLPSKAAPAATIASCVVGIGLGVESIRYSVTYPDAQFG
ncbi:hypothetical protein [Nannocystis sp.]|uniref:hypothetical protein n=1 Tax=Nannocystis sp. TaxID=1962667 RepID=UPI0025E18E26|nr:hypothetical protein [Nannocystis sp.]MBK7828278.1 hypothetical protein [Nannocystis sp.]